MSRAFTRAASLLVVMLAVTTVHVAESPPAAATDAEVLGLPDDIR